MSEIVDIKELVEKLDLAIIGRRECIHQGDDGETWFSYSNMIGGYYCEYCGERPPDDYQPA